MPEPAGRTEEPVRSRQEAGRAGAAASDRQRPPATAPMPPKRRTGTAAAVTTPAAQPVESRSRSATAELARLAPCVYWPSFVWNLGDNFTSPVLSLVAVQLSGGGVGAAGTVAAAMGLASMTMQLPGSALYERLGGKWALALGAAFAGAGTLGGAAALWVRSFPAFVSATAAMGAGRAVLFTSRTAYTRELAPVWLRGRACAIEGGVSRAAGVVAPLVGGSVAARYGIAGPFVLGGAVKLLGAVLFLLGPNRRKTSPQVPQQQQAIAKQTVPAAGTPVSSYLSILMEERTFFFRGACVAICGLTVLRHALNIFVPLIGRNLNLSVQQIGAAMSTGNFFDTMQAQALPPTPTTNRFPGTLQFSSPENLEDLFMRSVLREWSCYCSMFLPTGYGYDRFGRRPMFLSAVLTMSLGWFSLSFATSAASLVRGTVLIGLGHGLTSGIQSLTGSDFAPPAPKTTSFLGLYMLANDAATLAGPVLLTRLAQWTTVLASTRATAALGLASATWYYLLVPERRVAE